MQIGNSFETCELVIIIVYCDIIREASDRGDETVYINKYLAEKDLLSSSNFLNYTSFPHFILLLLSLAFLNVDQKISQVN